MAAIRNARPQAVNLLLAANKKSIHAKNHLNNNALMLAAANGDVQLVEKLIKAGVLLDEQNNVGDTALRIAVRRGHLTVTQTLLDSGANATLRNKRREWAAQIAESQHRQDLESLISKRADHSQGLLDFF